MKLCPVCQEEFADKFSFCPVDGTPLKGSVARSAEPSKPVSQYVPEPTPAATPVEEFENEDTVTVMAGAAAAGAASASQASHAGEYHLTIIEDRGITSRLLGELREVSRSSQLTWPEFKRDPMGFVKRSIVAYAQMLKRFIARPNVAIAMGAAVLSMAVIIIAVAWLDRAQSGQAASRAPVIVFTLIALGVLVAIFAGWMKRDRSVSTGGSLSG